MGLELLDASSFSICAPEWKTRWHWCATKYEQVAIKRNVSSFPVGKGRNICVLRWKCKVFWCYTREVRYRFHHCFCFSAIPFVESMKLFNNQKSSGFAKHQRVLCSKFNIIYLHQKRKRKELKRWAAKLFMSITCEILNHILHKRVVYSENL